jgi:hypothetical protein
MCYQLPPQEGSDDFVCSVCAMPVQLATLQLATLQLATLQLVTFQLATLTTRHPDNSSLWQLATLTTRHLTTRHYDNSPPWPLATITTRHHGVYAWIILFVLIIFYFNVCTAYCSPDFSFNILQIFSSDQWDLLSHNLFVIFFIRLYRCLLQMNYISRPNFCVVVFVVIHHFLLHFDYVIFKKKIISIFYSVYSTVEM